MTSPSMNPMEWVRKRLEEDGEDLVREMLHVFAQALLSADADAACGASYGSRSPERANRRNGYRERPWDTRVGTIPLAIPKLREGTYFPEWLLEPRRRAERALVAVVCEAYVNGVSTRKVDHLVQAMGLSGISKSRVSEMVGELDAMVEDFRNRPLDGRFPYLWLDALMVRCREGGRIVQVALVVAIGVTHDGRREILGADVITSEDHAGWRGSGGRLFRPPPTRRGAHHRSAARREQRLRASPDRASASPRRSAGSLPRSRTRRGRRCARRHSGTSEEEETRGARSARRTGWDGLRSRPAGAPR